MSEIGLTMLQSPGVCWALSVYQLSMLTSALGILRSSSHALKV